jgi:hypothetical protein
MFTGGAQFIFQATALASKKDISSVYSDFLVSNRLADLFELFQKWNLKYYINL